MRLFLGLPTAGNPSQPFLESLGSLRLPAACTEVERYVVTGNFIPAQRELIADEALNRGFDVLAMIDDDIVIPPDALEKLCAALDDDPQTALVGALYYSRDGLRPMAVDAWESQATTSALVPAFDDRTATLVDGVGFGCTVIRLAAVAAFERPLFSAQVFIERAARRVRITDEDYLFCERLRTAGMRVRLHGGVRCGHFDRASNRVVPERWEDPQVTAHERMYVRTPEGERLIEPDFSLERGREEHRPVTIDYLSVD